MGRRIFWIFALVVALSTGLAIGYIQSEKFANILKDQIKRQFPEDSGVKLDFDRLTVGILPPSVSLVNVSIQVERSQNIAGLRVGSFAKVGRLGITFKMLQAFSRGVTINKVFVQSGEVSLRVPPGSGDSDADPFDLLFNPILVKVDKSLQFLVQQLELRESSVKVVAERRGKAPVQVAVEKIGVLSLAPEQGGFSAVANLEGVAFEDGTTKERLEAIKGNVDMDPAGVRVSSLDLQRKAEAAHIEGNLLGNIREPENLKVALKAIVRGSAADLAEFVGPTGDLQGDLLADLKVTGSVRSPNVEGSVQASGLKYGLWNIEKVQAGAKWAAGTLRVGSLELKKSGGIVRLAAPLEVSFPLPAQELKIRLEAENASYLEFAGEALKDVSVIKGDFHGAVDVGIGLAKSKNGVDVTEIQVLPNLRVSGFELNNQVYGKSRPYKKIIGTKNPFQLKGAVKVKGGDIQIQDTSLTFPSGTLQVNGGLSKGSGWNIIGDAPQVDLGRELGDISGLPVVGNGAVKAHIHGKGDDIFFDFDLKQKDAKFLNFDFGELEGKVSIDDRNSLVFLDRLLGKMNNSRYEVNGSVSIDGNNDDIDLTARFVKTAPDDLFKVFAYQLRQISWIPHGMTGEIDGIARVTGGYDKGIDSLQIKADLRGSRLLYKGEYVSELTARAGLDRGTIFAQNVRARKFNSEFVGEIQYFRNDEMKYQLSVPRGKVRDLDWVAGLGFPLEGTWEIQSSGQGKWEALKSQTQINLRNLVVRTKPVQAMAVEIKTDAEAVAIGVESEQKDVSLQWRMARKAGAESSFAAHLRRPELNWVLCALNRKTCADERLHLWVAGDYKMKWPSGDLRRGLGRGTLRELAAEKESVSIGLENPVEIAGIDGEIRSQSASIVGTETKLNLTTASALDGSKIDWRLKGDGSLRVLEFVTSLIEEARGQIGIDVNLGGSPAKVNGSGRIAFKGGTLRINGLDAPVEDLNGRLVFRGESVQFEDTNARIGGGEARLGGGIKLHLDRAPEMGIDIFLTNNRIRFFPVNFAEFDEARLSFSGEKPPYMFGGLARVRRVLMKKNFDFGGRKTQRGARYLPESVGRKSSIYELKIRALAERGVVIENDLLNAEFRGEVSLLNNFEFPQVTARAELVKGTLNFRNTPFALDHAVVRMPNPEYFDPQFSVGGTANLNGYKVNIFAAGTSESPRISLSSSPSLSQEDILSLLAFGYTGTEARKINPDDKSALTYTEVGSLLLDQLKLNRDLQQRGFKISVAPSIRDSEANIIRPRTTGGSAAPKVYLKTQVMKNLDASVGSAFGSSQGGNELDATLDYRVGSKASVGAIYEQEPGIQVNEPRRSYGADVKFRWGFK